MSKLHTPLVEVELPGISLRAPDDHPRVFAGAHGTLWQWLGDGIAPLISLTVATRETQIGTETGTRHHLNWEIDRLSGGFDAQAGGQYVQDAPVDVRGAWGASGSTVDGVRKGIRTHNRVVVASDGIFMHVVHVMVPDTDPGRKMADSLTEEMSLGSRSVGQSAGGGAQ